MIRTWQIWDPIEDPRAVRLAAKTRVTRPREHARAIVVGSWPVGDPPPTGGDARAWDSWRLRRGYAGGRR